MDLDESSNQHENEKGRLIQEQTEQLLEAQTKHLNLQNEHSDVHNQLKEHKELLSQKE